MEIPKDITTSLEAHLPIQDLSGIVGHRLVYTYANSWQYEVYVKNATTIDYRIHSGHVGGRWVKDQEVDLVVLAPDVYKVSWTEPTGTSVVLNVLPGQRVLHGTVFFPHWIKLDGSKTALFQNDHLDEMRRYRDAGPTYPIYVVSKFAHITLFENVGKNDETVIDAAPVGRITTDTRIPLTSDTQLKCNLATLQEATQLSAAYATSNLNGTDEVPYLTEPNLT